MTLYATLKIKVLGREFLPGQELVDVPPSYLRSMVRLGQADTEPPRPAAAEASGDEAPERPLARLKKDELLALATDAGLELTGEETKAQLVALLQAADDEREGAGDPADA